MTSEHDSSFDLDSYFSFWVRQHAVFSQYFCLLGHLAVIFSKTAARFLETTWKHVFMNSNGKIFKKIWKKRNWNIVLKKIAFLYSFKLLFAWLILHKVQLMTSSNLSQKMSYWLDYSYCQRRTKPFLSRGAVLIYFLLLLGGRDDTSKSVIVTLSNLRGVTTAPLPPLGMAQIATFILIGATL